MEQPPKKEPRGTADSRQTQMADAFRNLQQCVQTCHKAVFFTDAAGILQRVNPAFERLTGYPSFESVGKDLSWIAADGPESESYRRLWHEIYENSAFRGVIEVRRRDGNSLQMELTAIPVRDRDGQITSLVCTGRDLREGQGVEVKLSEARKLNAIATLARAVAHDLNNTLMVISSSSELALDGVSHEDPLWRRLHEIHGAAQRACELAGEMLAFGRNTQERELVSLNSLVQETCRVLPRVTGPDVQIQVVLGTDAGQVDANVAQVQQLLLSLAVSARDAMPDGGRLIISTSGTDLEAAKRTRTDAPSLKCALLSVSVVKPAKAAERVPSASLTADAITGQRWIRESELASVEELARENHGFVAVERGSNGLIAVNVYLPIAEQSEETSVLESGFHPSETVLLVEDESVIRTAACEFLSSNGYNVLCATNGQEALDQILSHPGRIDLVITDVIMPQMSGPKLAEAAAAIRPDTRVLFVSGNRDHPGLNLGSADSAYNFLLKPFSLGALGNKVREVLEQPATGPQRRAVGAGAN